MAKKTKKAKNRLDKYYYLAKEHNYRSRAAFKLIQLNAKHHFLESANILLDLCAAPGGWCQVASKLMPIESTIIGVDLDPIKPIPNVTTYQADITTERCRTLIQNQIKHLKVDVVLNDGAPNVGGQWSKDSFSQTELVLYAVKLATEFLKKGGWFVTKVFRSGDYNSLMYVFRQLFGNVVANKPLASRAQAAEIFVVCSNYKAPAHIDAKLLDPKYALKQLEEEDEMKSNAIKSIKAMFDKKKHRSGYNTESFYNKRTFKEFIECANPYQFLIDNNKIEIKTDDCKEYVKVCKAPSEYEFYFEDLQLLGKKEIQELIIWRNRIRTKSQAKLKEMMNEQQQQHGKEEEIHDDNESGNEQHVKEKEEDDDVEEEMDEEIRQYEKMKKKKENREKRLQEKNELTQKKKYIEQEEQEQVQDNDVEFEEGVFDYIRKHKLNIEDFGKEDDDDNDNKEEEKEGNEDELGKYEEMNLSDLDEDDLIDMMNEDIEENKRLYEEEKGKSVLKKKNKNKKEVDGIQLVEQEKEDDLSDSDKADNEYDNEESEQGDDSDYYDNDNEDDNDIDIDENEANTNDDKNDNDNDNNDITITNPLRKAKKEKQQTQQQQQPTTTPANKSEDENALSSDTDEETKQPKTKTNKTKETFLNKKTQRTPKEQNDVESNSEGKDTSSDEDDGYNTDEKAEIRAIAKKMLRKKERLNILNSTYNRYAFNEEDRAPKWFIDDEKQHNVPNKPVTKAEILAERAYLKKITDRMPKKVLEAKARKRNKLNKRLEKVKKKAEAIANQEEINEFSKVRQIEKLYRKELSKGKEKKKYIISRAHTGNNRGKDGRNIKHVDRRLKKDKRAEKSRERRNKKYKRRR